jgi:hypothetical protein
MQQYLKTNTPIDNSVLGVYFESLLFEAVSAELWRSISDKNKIICIQKGYEPVYLKKTNKGDIDVLAEIIDSNEITHTFMLEGKSLFQIGNDLDNVINKVLNRYKIWSIQSENINKIVHISLHIWYLENTDLKNAKDILDDKLKDCEIKNIVFKYEFHVLSFAHNDSLSENSHNSIFNKEILLTDFFDL